MVSHTNRVAFRFRVFQVFTPLSWLQVEGEDADLQTVEPRFAYGKFADKRYADTRFAESTMIRFEQVSGFLFLE